MHVFGTWHVSLSLHIAAVHSSNLAKRLRLGSDLIRAQLEPFLVATFASLRIAVIFRIFLGLTIFFLAFHLLLSELEHQCSPGSHPSGSEEEKEEPFLCFFCDWGKSLKQRRHATKKHG